MSVWTYFKEDVSQTNLAICQICANKDHPKKTVISRGNPNKGKKGFSTTPLIRHLQRAHPLEYKELTKESMVKPRRGEITEGGGDIETVFASTSSSSEPKKRMIQPCIFDINKRRKLWDINDQKSKDIHYLIGEMICLDNQPFQMVENEGFKRLMNHIIPQYKIPSRKYFSENIVPYIYEKVSEKMSHDLKAAQAISLTSDIWTCSYNNVAFISTSAHWLTDIFEKKSYVLEIGHFPENHTALNISSKVTDSLKKWNISKDKVHAIITDNAPNIVAGCRNAGLNNETCVIHSLQLVIHDAILSQRSVNDTIAKAKQIVGHFKRSPTASEHLKKLQEKHDDSTKIHKLFQDVSTRWNSTFYMLERLVEQKKVITLYAADHNINNLSSNEWELAMKVVKLLKPFEEMTRLLSEDDACISKIIPHIKALELFLETSGKDVGVQKLKNELLISIRKRFIGIQENKILVLATALDPRYKDKGFESLDQQKIRNSLYEEVKNSLTNQIQSESSDSETDNAAQIISSNQEDSFSLKDCLSKVLNKSSSRSTGTSTSFIVPKSDMEEECSEAEGSENSQITSKKVKKKIEQEIQMYFQSDNIATDASPYKWWRDNSNNFQTSNLGNLARKYLGAPPSSVFSERMFSQAGNIYTQTRSCLDPTLADKLLVVHCNLPRLNYKY